MAEKAVSPSCFRSSLPCPFSWCPLCHSFSPSVVAESGNVSSPSVYSLLYNVYGVIYTRLKSYPGIILRLWSCRVMPSMMRSIFRCATDSSSMWAFFSAHVSLPYTMTGNTYSLCTFLCIFIQAFQLFMMFAILLNAAHPSAMRLLIAGRRSPAYVTVLP